MQRAKIIRKIGDSIGIILNKEEPTLFELSIGDTVNVNIKKIKQGGKK